VTTLRRRTPRDALAATLLAAVLASPPAAGQAFQPPSSGFSPPGTFPYGAPLQGKRIVVSPGHGWEGGTDGAYQRDRWKWSVCGTCEGIVEDLYTAETCADHLVPLLRQAGAIVQVAREQDRQARETIVDDGDPGYREEGPWRAGATAGLGWAGGYRTLFAPEGGSAAFTVLVPAEGDWWLQARWAAGANRCPDTRIRVFHGDLASVFTVDQRTDGTTWNYLARLHFPAGPATVVVEAPAEGDCYVIADAVRVGGGTDAAAALPRWKMSAEEWLAFDAAQGVAGIGDVTVRPAWAEALGADLYLSLHANAGGTSTTSGTSSYRYNCGTDARWEPLDPAACDDPEGSAALQYAVQQRIVDDLRDGWDPAWQDGGRLVANFGEVRVLDTMPGVLVESAFFDGTDTPPGGRYPDNRALHDPRFRYVLARAIVRAVVRIVSPGAEVQAEPPTHLALRNAGGGVLRATWRAAEGARGYRVYVARGGRNFDGGTVVEGTSLDLPAGEAGVPAFVRVSSLNGGGESRASGAVGALARTDGGPADLVVVDAFERQDAWVREDGNHRDYVVEHGLAVAAAGGWAFDGADQDAVAEGDVALSAYRAADFILGRESSEHETFSDARQAQVAAFLDGGGCLLASGTEIAWDLGALGSPADQAFLAGRLGASLEEDDAGVWRVEGEAGSPFEGLATLHLDDGTGPTYAARFCDVLHPEGAARVLLRYSDGGVAAVGLQGPAGLAMLLGFPVETVLDLAARADLVGRVLAACGRPSPPVEPGPEAAEASPEAHPEWGHDLPSFPEWPEGTDVPGDRPAVDDPSPPGDTGPADSLSEGTSTDEAPGRRGGGCTAGNGGGRGPAGAALAAALLLAMRGRVRRRKGAGDGRT
jgi:N-acetylmuramoyl-L-alanine amidase